MQDLVKMLAARDAELTALRARLEAADELQDAVDFLLFVIAEWRQGGVKAEAAQMAEERTRNALRAYDAAKSGGGA